MQNITRDHIKPNRLLNICDFIPTSILLPMEYIYTVENKPLQYILKNVINKRGK